MPSGVFPIIRAADNRAAAAATAVLRRQTADGRLHLGELTSHIQSTFGGHFSPLFRYQADKVRLDTAGDSHHLLGDRHFQIHWGLQCLTQNFHVPIRDMTTILAQVDGDAIGARLLG